MNDPVKANERVTMENELAFSRVLMSAYKNLIGLDQPTPSKLVDHALKSIGPVSRHVDRLQREIAKMDVKKTTK